MDWDKVRNEGKYARGASAYKAFAQNNQPATTPRGIHLLKKKDKCYACKQAMSIGEPATRIKIGKHSYEHHLRCAGIDL